METAKGPSEASFMLKKKAKWRNRRNHNISAHKNTEEGGLCSTDNLNNMSTLSLLDQGNSETIPSSDVDETKHVHLAISDKKIVPSETSPLLTKRVPANHMKKKLLILDLNGLLVDVVSPPPKGYEADIKIARRAVFRRPFCLDFLKFCFERFEVGIWSSRTKKNIDRMIDYLVEDMKHKLLFCWDLSQCTATQFNTLENRHKPLVFKELRRIWGKHDPRLPWEKGYFNESNTLLVDDSPYKALLNPVHTAIFPCSFQFQDKNDNALGAEGNLRVYLEDLAAADDVQKFVEQHPFGQRAITERSPSWAFYLHVIHTLHPFPIPR